MPEKILYFLADLLPLVDASTATIIDVRSPGAYQRGHIPGAVNIPEVFTYLLPESSDQGLADMASYFAGLFATAGVERHRPVLFYEDNLASQFGGACRGYWLLTYLGHPSAGVLADGLQGWQQAGHALETVTPRPAPGHFTAAPRPEMIASERDVLQAIATIETILLDDRDEPEWLGLSSSPYDLDFAPRKGKIPSAQWLHWLMFMNEATPPAFRTTEEIRALCANQGITPDDDIIIYCFKGSRAAHTYVALKLAGFRSLRVYFGSWNEWSRNPALPVAS